MAARCASFFPRWQGEAATPSASVLQVPQFRPVRQIGVALESSSRCVWCLHSFSPHVRCRLAKRDPLLGVRHYLQDQVLVNRTTEPRIAKFARRMSLISCGISAPTRTGTCQSPSRREDAAAPDVCHSGTVDRLDGDLRRGEAEGSAARIAKPANRFRPNSESLA
jgi:hypothetical protein